MDCSAAPSHGLRRPYSAKARKHKQVHPYVRYGVVASSAAAYVAGRVFNHNKSLDFSAAVANLDASALRTFSADLFELEVAASRRLEGIFFGATRTRLFRSEIVVLERDRLTDSTPLVCSPPG